MMINNSPEYYDTRALFSLYVNEEKCCFEDIERRLEENLAALKKDFTEQQRLLLLEIIDDKDLIRSRATSYYYAKGFRRALMLMAESFYGGD